MDNKKKAYARAGVDVDLANKLKGSIGPRVNVKLEGYSIGDKTARDLLPVKREGSIDESAIVEGERRLENRLQEEGYFFTEVTHSCAVFSPML